MGNLTKNHAFTATRKPVLNSSQLQLCSDLLVAGWSNIRLYSNGQHTKRYHFHIVNKNNYAVTVVLTKKNDILVRGHKYNKLDEMLRIIERIQS